MRLIRRQLFGLALLIAVTASVFIFTRNTAAGLRETKARQAAVWYGRGQEALDRGEIAEGIDLLRQATQDSPDTLLYSLALTQALVDAGQPETARPILLRLRQSSPENPRINLQLARLEGSQGELFDAIRFYQNALYGVWPDGQEEAQRQLRLELVEFLLDRGETSAARSELLVLTRTVPAEPAAHVELGQLFLDANAPGEAWPQFEAAIELSPMDGPALVGAGEALFELGDYAQAQRLLASAAEQEATTPRTERLMQVAALVESADPLLPRLRTTVRQRRLTELAAYEVGRLQTCPLAVDWDVRWAELEDLQHVLESPQAVRDDPDVVQRGFELVLRTETGVSETCPTTDILSEALLLIGKEYANADSQL